jgi:hypothetical protein
MTRAMHGNELSFRHHRNDTPYDPNGRTTLATSDRKAPTCKGTRENRCDLKSLLADVMRDPPAASTQLKRTSARVGWFSSNRLFDSCEAPVVPAQAAVTAPAYGLVLMQGDPPWVHGGNAGGRTEMVAFSFGGFARQTFRSAGAFTGTVADCFARLIKEQRYRADIRQLLGKTDRGSATWA